MSTSAGAPARTSLRVLVAEDSEDDFLLIQAKLRSAGFDVTAERVATAADMRGQLAAHKWDLVLSDFTMPQFIGSDALRLLQESPLAHIPFIIVSGSIGEERAVAALKAGAANYVMKANLDKLVPVVERELKDAEMRRERNQAFEELAHAVKVRDEFISIASHELKTPLTSLGLQVEGLLRLARGREPDPIAYRKLLSKVESIARSSDRLGVLIDRLLDITRVTTGRLELYIEEVDASALGAEVVACLEDLFRDAGSPVSITAPGPARGRWDRERLEIVLSNLLTNAAKYGMGKPIALEIEDGPRAVRIRVVDHGIGIEPADQQRIFERFERAVPQRNYGGFGVGLWLARRIVEAHGGTLEVISRAGAGSTFTMSLPKS